MSFIRTKKIKHYEYAYLVKNKWKGTSSRQKVIGYLGRVHSFPEQKVLFEFDYVNGSYKDLCNALFRWQLKMYGFVEDKGILVHEGIRFNPNTYSLRNTRGNEIVIKSHEGFLCKKTMKDLVAFNAEGYEEEVGYVLAKTFVEAGLNIPKQIFIWAFEKVYKHKD